MITDIWGIIPEERTLRKKMEAYPVRLSMPSWILAAAGIDEPHHRGSRLHREVP